MTDIATLKARYFVSALDANPPTEPVPNEYDHCKVTPLIDGANFNAQIQTALSLVGAGPDPVSNAGDFILIHNWWLALVGGTYKPAKGFFGSEGPTVIDLDPYFLDGPGGTIKLIDLLKEKARVGVDVRVMGWASNALMANSFYNTAANVLSIPLDLSSVNAGTMKSVKELRSDATLRPYLNVQLSNIGHTAGAVHTKLVVIGTNSQAVGFTGGIDFQSFRWAHPMHPGGEVWHDIAAKVEGPAVQALYDWFSHLWNENLKNAVARFRFEGDEMPSFLPRTPVLPARALPLNEQLENHSVQSLRTVPLLDYKWYNCLPENPPVSFAKEGLFEVRAARRKALLAAETYIYMEDQSFWSQEIFDWVNSAVRSNASLRVIILAGIPDPVDPPPPEGYFVNAINNHLLKDLTPSHLERVRLFRRLGYFMHSKTTLVDDQWAITGSANVMRRSLYTDLEHSVSFLDPAEALVREFRMALWADHFQHPTAADFADIQHSFFAWDPTWGTPGPAPHRPTTIESLPLPLPNVNLSDKEISKYETYLDADSREPWGGLCP